MTRSAPSELPEIILEPSHGWVNLRLGELWEYREMLFFLAWRDVMVRYKQTILGILWVLLQPLLSALIFAVVFGRYARLPSDGVNYGLFTLAALLPWNLFAGALTRSTASLVLNANLIRKVYFPRLMIPTAAVLAVLVDFVITLPVIAVLIAVFRQPVTWSLLTLPLWLILSIFLALGTGYWLSALNALYRDVGHAAPFFVTAWMYASPVVYALSLIPERWQWLYGLNPMVGVITGFRWCLLGTPLPVFLVLESVLVTAILFISGLIFFRRTEKIFADVV